jgi:uncharacterized protein (DUF1697 family)
VTRTIALVRAVNVGGTGKLPMAELTNLLAGTYTNVKTLLQSGNVVFGCDGAADAALETTLEAAVARAFGLRTTFYVRSAREWDTVIANNPFPAAAITAPGQLIVMALKTAPPPAAVAALQAAIAGNETLQTIGKHAYIVYPDGQAQTKLTNALIERTLGVTGTARNWNTVLKLQAAVAALT